MNIFLKNTCYFYSKRFSKSPVLLYKTSTKKIKTIGDNIMSKIKYVYVKDDEGFVTKKPENTVLSNETLISKQEYEQISGIEYYKKTFGRGGARINAGRKKIYTDKVKETYELEKSDVICLKDYAKKHKISKNKAISQAINILIKLEA